ncbi:AIR synthase family protein [Clostridium sp. SYSU_GA19001]|uniref:AIR synthase family protein n=1 Tax=Clostridium caldaquaticum TaxID=2940653 RepID=UPI0020771AB5|nr:AIR synthase family protein [Clostridium caldaquaticum]MCM8711861.1 AIR synthase family protein [Clostridium caldaquaticum]
MKAGKLNWDDLNEIISNNRSVDRKDVRVKSGIGEDCSIIEYGDFDCVVSTDPITGADSDIGRLAVHINCNDIASCGVEPIGILVTILAPEGTTLDEIKDVMFQIDEETKKLNVEILGGHTEITRSVNKLIVSCTAIGKGRKGKAVATSGAQIGDDIIVTKELGMEGTSIVINDYFNYVKDVLSNDEIEEAKGYINSISVVKEGIIAGEFGVNSMHDITEGGVLGALWEMATASKVGFKVYRDKMPVSKVTENICSKLRLDPLRFISSGSMLITSKNGEALVKKLKNAGINAVIIGKITENKGILVENKIEYEVKPPERDELFVIDENINKFCI